MNNSYTKDSRLKSFRQFQQVLERGKGIRGKYIVVYSHLTPNSPFTKFGIIASKKYGKAVERNRFKRIAREAFRKIKSTFPTGMQIVLKPRKPALEASMHHILDELLELSKQFGESTQTTAE